MRRGEQGHRGPRLRQEGFQGQAEQNVHVELRRRRRLGMRLKVQNQL